jgi:hypothetical protein
MVPIWNGSNLGSFQNGSRVGYPAMSDEPCFPQSDTEVPVTDSDPNRPKDAESDGNIWSRTTL